MALNSPSNSVNSLEDTIDQENVSDNYSDKKIEPLLTAPKNKQLTILPVQHDDLWAMYKTHEAAIWHAHEVDLSKDEADWNKLTDNEKHFIKYVLAFFASSDLIVNENLAERFLREVQYLEAKTFYTFQSMMENIHSETYANLVLKYITDKKEQTFILNAVENIDCIKKKADWAHRWITGNDSFVERLVAFASVEGIFFSGAFCCIYWLKERGVLPGLSTANDFIARDEGLHTDFACQLYNKHIVNKLSQQRIEQIIREAVDLEIDFITKAIPCRLIGINANLMIDYIKYVADRLLLQLGHKIAFGAKQPFGFMDRIALHNKGNFFETRITSYSKGQYLSDDEDPYAD